ncbi:hypothetical protein GOP47_0004829 [Adiantum capillus-veneris]|uniref:Sulfotransferase n=1 Tax=Adiantum capillus-veneris TaxID=13818 RepID=A0A9D4V400_ADICA|nr:hypothetical protein GOP47_0004829 [Adiantum capillus-veneris]
MMQVWLRASAFLLRSALLARKVCTFAGAWLTYLCLVRPAYLKRKPSTHGDIDMLNKKKLQPTNASLFLKAFTTGNIDMLNKKKLQVILCGFPKTGTVSLMKDLEILGFPCFHGC